MIRFPPLTSYEAGLMGYRARMSMQAMFQVWAARDIVEAIEGRHNSQSVREPHDYLSMVVDNDPPSAA